ncbi:NigD1/NigD2 family lipoprotein [Saccharicrinis fermentans]|uniref:NigD-like protein n=1 Tax=Saccharicrinis fermentans DSM 9555 = JCM 21142 TaxID=869213 RepID=W7YLW6_9BACT|nr:NigD-like C-terminal domain-containing protein [Saccharicrinis fermentans]GAF05621.1 NigD-like protein [Saccharicrinis fermentans DSM 9555 = JCM 21142]
MKKLLLFLGVMVLFKLTSCDVLDDDSDYSLDNFSLSSGTVLMDVDSYSIKTDNGKVLWPSASNVSVSLLEDSMRVLVNYTILGEATDNDSYDYYVRVNGLSKILTKPVFEFTSETTADVIDSIGDDAVTIVDTWFTDDYLNVEFEYGGGATVHYINLVFDAENPTTEDGAIILELKHNHNGDPYSYLQWGIASFDVSAFQTAEKDTIDFFVRSKGKDGAYNYNQVLTYSYGSASVEESINKQYDTENVSLLQSIQ